MAPLVGREEARALTWGGAAANEAARLRRRGERDDDDADDPFPAPEILPALVPLWATWFDSRRSGAVGQDSFSGTASWDHDAVKGIAAAHGEPVDAVFLERFAVMFGAFRLEVAKHLERERKASERRR